SGQLSPSLGKKRQRQPSDRAARRLQTSEKLLRRLNDRIIEAAEFGSNNTSSKTAGTVGAAATQRRRRWMLRIAPQSSLPHESQFGIDERPPRRCLPPRRLQNRSAAIMRCSGKCRLRMHGLERCRNQPTTGLLSKAISSSRPCWLLPSKMTPRRTHRDVDKNKTEWARHRVRTHRAAAAPHARIPTLRAAPSRRQPAIIMPIIIPRRRQFRISHRRFASHRDGDDDDERLLRWPDHDAGCPVPPLLLLLRTLRVRWGRKEVTTKLRQDVEQSLGRISLKHPLTEILKIKELN
uniref:BHLH domain-containing protein n=1 Tax=Macrostomum lignano TaxID=282301 RepID=A0A1I8F794_9PLAT